MVRNHSQNLVYLNVCNIVQVAGSLVLDLNDDDYLNVCNVIQVAGSLVLDLNDDVYLSV